MLCVLGVAGLPGRQVRGRWSGLGSLSLRRGRQDAAARATQATASG